MSEKVYLVRLKSGVVVQMTRAEYEAMWKGTDREAVAGMSAPADWEWEFSQEC